MICWNVRGLNEKEKRLVVRQSIKMEKPHIICIQETKWCSLRRDWIKQTCGHSYDMFTAIDVDGTTGGVFIAWKSNTFSPLSITKLSYCLSVDLQFNRDGSFFRFTGVYGPSTPTYRGHFFTELQHSKLPVDNLR